MNLYQESAALLQQIADETDGLKTGEIPSIPELLHLQGRLVSLYHRLGEELSEAFTAKELRYLGRKVSAARHHLAGRLEFKLTQEDARQEAVKRTEEEYRQEIEAMSLFEQTKILRDSLGRAFDYLQQTISTLKWMESRPADQ